MKKLTRKQKQKNKTMYKVIRKYYEEAMSHPNASPISYIQFKRRVKAEMIRSDSDYKTAAKKTANTESFVSPAERSRFNLVEAIKEKFPGEYKELRNLSRNKKGQFTSIRDNLVWNNELKGYILGNKYFIDVTNSPEEVIITTL